MTAIVGFLCEDGVVIGSDSAASFGFGDGRTIEQSVKKIDIIGDHVIVAGTGQVGLGQRFRHLVRELYDKKEFSEAKHDHIKVGKLLSQRGQQDFAETHTTKGGYGCLVAFSQGKKFHLVELAVGDFQPEFKTADMPFATLGCGQPITDPFLAFLWKVFFAKGLPKLEDGKFIATWALLHAIELNPGGVNGPLQVAVLRNDNGQLKATLLEEGELEEQAASVQAAEEHLRNYQKDLGGANPVEIPKPPIPTPAVAPK